MPVIPRGLVHAVKLLRQWAGGSHCHAELVADTLCTEHWEERVRLLPFFVLQPLTTLQRHLGLPVPFWRVAHMHSLGANCLFMLLTLNPQKQCVGMLLHTLLF